MDEMQDDVKGIFDMEGASVNKSHDRNSSTNYAPGNPHFELQQHQWLPPRGYNIAHQHQQSPLKKRTKKSQKLNFTSSSSIEGRLHKSLEHGQIYEVDTHSKNCEAAANQPSTSPCDMGSAPPSFISQWPVVKKKASTKKMTVTDPSPDVLEWVSGMSRGRQRRNIQAGVRVKVRFEFKSNKRRPDGKKRYFNWCGGCVTHVGPEGKKIKILYDNGTSEETGFPDIEIVVDDNGNGRHEVPVDTFLPKQPAILMAINEANQGVSSDNHSSVTNSIGNNSFERVPAHEILPQGEVCSETLHEIISKPTKEECMEETGALKLHKDLPQGGINNCASKISHVSSTRRFSNSNVSESSYTTMQSERDVGTAGDTHNFPSSRNWGYHNSGRSFHPSGIQI